MFSELTISGWIFLILGWGFVFSLVIFCMCKLMMCQKKKKTEEA